MTEHEPLPTERQSITKKILLGELEGYVTVGFYEAGRAGEMFLTMHRVGTFEHGLLHALALSVSVGLQHGVPLEKYVEKFRGMAFEPAGAYKDGDETRFAASVLDWLARWLEKRVLKRGVKE